MNTGSLPISNGGITVPTDAGLRESLGFLPSQADTVNGTGAIFKLERQFRQHLGCDHALAVCNATLGLMAAFDVCGVRNGEVIVPPYTWGGSLSGLMYLGNRPVFADIDKETLTLNPESVKERITSRTTAILAVDIYGNPCHAEKLRQIADEYSVWLIQDCAQSFGANIGGRQSGHLADLSVFSFSPGKDLSASSGGMICCQDSSLYEKLVWQTQHPDRQKRDVADMIPNQFALNLRMDSDAASSLSVQFEQRLNSIQIYQTALEKIDRCLAEVFCLPPMFRDDYKPSGYRYTFDSGSLNRGRDIVEAINRWGVGAKLTEPPCTCLLYDDLAYVSSSHEQRPRCPFAESAVRHRKMIAFDDLLLDISKTNLL